MQTDIPFTNTDVGAKKVSVRGELYGALQQSLEVDAVLAVARVYDAPSKKYPARCLRAALELMTSRVQDLPEIVERSNIKRSLAFLGEKSPVIGTVDLGRDAFVAQFVPEYRSTLESGSVVKAIETLKHIRDKRIAHNEAAMTKGPTWEALKQLIDHAKDFVGVVGWAFCGCVYTNDGKYLLSDDAKRPSRALNGLLERLR